MEKLQAFVDEAEVREKARLDAMVADLQEARNAHKVGRKRAYLPLGSRVFVRATVVPIYHQCGRLYRLLDRQELPDTIVGYVVGVRFLAEGRYHKYGAIDEDGTEPAYLETYRAIPVYLVARTLFTKPMQILLDDVEVE